MADASPAETVLALLKADLGVTHTKRDEYFAALIAAAGKMLRTEGVVLDMDDPGDQLLLEMYAAHLHERRQQPTLAMPRYLRAKINNRLCHQQMQG